MRVEEIAARIRVGEDVKNNMGKLWEECRGFVYLIAKRYRGYTDMEELAQEGFLALVDAAKAYDPGRGMSFLNYAAFFLQARFRRYVFTCCQAVKLPEHVSRDVCRYKQACNEYEKQHGRAPDSEQIAAIMGVDKEDVTRIEKAAGMGRIQSLSEVITEEGDVTLGDSIPSGEDLEADVSELQDLETMSADLWEAVDDLPEEQRDVIRARWIQGKTFKECGKNAAGLQSRAFWALSKKKKLKQYHEEYLAAAPVYHMGVESFKRTMCSEVERAALGFDDYTSKILVEN